MTTVYPPGSVTRLGSEMLLEGVEYELSYTPHDRSRIFYLNGGQAPQALGISTGEQDGLVLQELSTPSPPFRHLDSQGAREDGVTWTDTVYEPMEIDMTLTAGAGTAAGLSRVVSDWIAACDPKKLGRLEWFTRELGLWFCDVRLNDHWPDRIKQSIRRQRKHTFTHTFRNDHSFWRGVDSVSTFQFGYEDAKDNFERAASSSLGASWGQEYEGAGAGTCGIDSRGDAAWLQSGTGAREVRNRYLDETTATDNQVISVVLGGHYDFPLPASGTIDIWGRLPNTGNAKTGIRARIGSSFVQLHYFVNGVGTLLAQRSLIFWPQWGETWRLVCGFSGDTRRFKLFRGAMEVLSAKDTAAGSQMGASFRRPGFGMSVAAGAFEQINPAPVAEWSMGDNATETQSGFLPLTNMGDQPGWPRYLVYGPGVFEFSNGHGSTDMIKFGTTTDPILDGQRVLIDTRPAWRSVVDVTEGQFTSAQVLDPPQQLLDQLIKLVTFNQVPPLLSWFESLFGIRPPQGILYSLLQGRFSRPIPGVPHPREATTSRIAVKVTGGNANTRVVAALTPLRRWPE